LKTTTLILGAILAAYCSAGTLSEIVWPNNERAERVLCRFFLCNNAPLVWRAREQLTEGKKENTLETLNLFRTALQRDPQDPYRWAELGDAFLEAGQNEDARYCFARVLTLAPHSAAFLMRVAEFHFQIGENQKALSVTARILALVPDYDSAIFDDYIRSDNRVEDTLQFGLPEGNRAGKSYLRFLIGAGRLEDAQHTWDWLVEHEYADDALAGEYVGFLIRQGHPEWAASAWAKIMGARADDYDESTYLFNGDFESDLTQSPFDWNVAQAEGVDVTRDCTIAWTGECSLRISFAGTHNLDLAAASQLAFIRSGAYRFHAFIRTEDLTTDQGVRFRISDAEVPARLDDVFGQFIGSSPWSSVDHDLIVARQTRILRIEMIRQKSVKFDNKVNGTAWIDHMKLEPITPLSPRQPPPPLDLRPVLRQKALRAENGARSSCRKTSE
jgi:tetratricopeptide (TPR) repeat protein